MGLSLLFFSLLLRSSGVQSAFPEALPAPGLETPVSQGPHETLAWASSLMGEGGQSARGRMNYMADWGRGTGPEDLNFGGERGRTPGMLEDLWGRMMNAYFFFLCEYQLSSTSLRKILKGPS